MRVVYTDEALHDLDEILEFVKTNYPGIFSSFENRLPLAACVEAYRSVAGERAASR